MDVFDLRQRLVDDYQRYTRSFIKIRDPRISAYVDQALERGRVLAGTAAPAEPDVPAGGHDRRSA